MTAALTQLVPIQELPPGSISAIRNEVTRAVLALASRELNLPEDKLIVRDIRPMGDLQIYSTTDAAAVDLDATSERWGYMATGTTIGWDTVTGSKTMGDSRYVAIFGVRDRGRQNVVIDAATLGVAKGSSRPAISFIKISVGGADRVMWDTTGIYSYGDAVAVCASAVVIPQNTIYNIEYYRMGTLEVGTTVNPTTDEIVWLQMMGIVVEPRGLVISP